MRELKDTGEVDLQDPLPVGEVDVFGGIAVNGASVVDEDIDVAEGGLDLGEELGGTGGGGAR